MEIKLNGDASLSILIVAAAAIIIVALFTISSYTKEEIKYQHDLNMMKIEKEKEEICK